MGRSVSYASYSVAVAYVDVSEYEEHAWQWFIESVQERAKNHWRSFENCSEWLGREDRAILSNSHAYIGVSEYCGLASIWLVAREDVCDAYGNYAPQLADNFCNQIRAKFLREFGELERMGTMSNGVGVFRKAV